MVAKYKVSHPGYAGPTFIVIPNETLIPLGKGYEITHRGIAPDIAADVVEQFRKKAGKIQTNHPYEVRCVFPDSVPPCDNNSIPAGLVDEHVVVEEPVVEQELDGMRIESGLDELLPVEIKARLITAGITTIEQVMEHPELTQIKGIEAADAATIYAALEKVTG